MKFGAKFVPNLAPCGGGFQSSFSFSSHLGFTGSPHVTLFRANFSDPAIALRPRRSGGDWHGGRPRRCYSSPLDLRFIASRFALFICLVSECSYGYFLLSVWGLCELVSVSCFFPPPVIQWCSGMSVAEASAHAIKRYGRRKPRNGIPEGSSTPCGSHSSDGEGSCARGGGWKTNGKGRSRNPNNSRRIKVKRGGGARGDETERVGRGVCEKAIKILK